MSHGTIEVFSWIIRVRDIRSCIKGCGKTDHIVYEAKIQPLKEQDITIHKYTCQKCKADHIYHAINRRISFNELPYKVIDRSRPEKNKRRSKKKTRESKGIGGFI